MEEALSPGQRQARGQHIRKRIPRSSHAEWKHEQRGRSALDILRDSMKGRLPRLLHLKYERMSASPFGYFRGAVPIMAYMEG